MTFEDDFVEFQMLGGRTIRATLKDLKIQWPPPLLIDFFGFPFKRVAMSGLTDEERKGLDHVCRGARYESDLKVPDLRAGITGTTGAVVLLDDHPLASG